MAEPLYLSKSAFASRIGRPPSYITWLKGNGRLVLSPDGKLVDVAATEARIRETADPSKASVAERHHQDRVEKGVYAHLTPAAEPSPASPSLPAAPDATPDYQKARARREFALALLTEDEQRKTRGELVERDLVDSAAFTAARALRNLLMGIPPRLAGELVMLTDVWDIEQRLTQALRRALEDADRLLQLDTEIEQGSKEPN